MKAFAGVLARAAMAEVQLVAANIHLFGMRVLVAVLRNERDAARAEAAQLRANVASLLDELEGK